MAISACNREAEAPQTGQAPATASGEQTLGERYVDLLPQWVPIANTPGGGSIAYDLKGVRAMMAQGRNEILLQVRHASPAEWRLPGEGGTRIITYNVEQVRMRFDCAKETYVILDRRVLDADGAVIETVAATEQELGAPLLVRENGLAQVARDPACAPRT
jgi:hypothetical protein